MHTVDEKGDDHTQDGTVDLKGRPVLRSKTGRWKGCSFMFGYEILERIAYHGVASSLFVYFTEELHEDTGTSHTHVNNWTGTVWLMPILGAYIADAHLGRYRTFIISALIYLVGIGLLTLTASLPALKPPSCPTNIKKENCKLKASAFQQAFFFLALYVIALGNGGTKPNISSMGADQFDNFEPKEKAQKISFFNWWMFSVFIGSFIANTVVVYIQKNSSWRMGYGIQTIGLGFAICLFLGGTPFYRHKKPQGSSYGKMFQVVVAAFRKWRVPVPNDPKDLHELSLGEYAKMEKYRINNSPALRFLDKAAVKTGPTSPWILCTVTQVEETKQVLKMVPFLIATIVPSMVFSLVHTLFIKQAGSLDRHLGGNFEIPQASLKSVIQVSMLVSVVLYDRFLVPVLRQRTNNPRGMTMLQRMGIGMFLYIVIMGSAYLSERKRMSVIRANSISAKGQTVPISVAIILPQYVLVGIADTFLEVAKMEFFYDQAPEGMKSLGGSYYCTGMGLGSFASVFITSITSFFTKRNGRQGWIAANINQSHLDYFYAAVTGLTLINFLYFLLIAKSYVYNADPMEHKKDALTLEMEDLPSIGDAMNTKDGKKTKY
ncbi:protein NRT1/ PTR FAMILY 5.2-like [Punica granatum]|uniref:Uncharacterized protein n=2 Tax=Punica granatum TaxID=22663 RepID=A0A218VST4_PUNGR|nr:protein NRT1/ PTR FAMILY 5.2-like [Punica granatum]OWM63555.1 hypothetical protein CDL15_Pgr019505 [Punica granatum]PKI31511.1 hypothetical protein CRG98_048092 [Punica granatum]